MENQEGMNPVENASGGTSEEKAVEVCSKCGAELQEGQDFCPKCGTPRGKKNVCGKCGAELQDGQEFCPKCGQKVGVDVNSNVSSAINEFNAGVEKKKGKKKIIPIILAIIAIGGIGAFVYFRGPSVDEVVLSKDSMEIKVGDSESVSYTISPQKASEAKVTWSTSNESVAKVDEKGKITGKGDGSCTITITAGGKTDSLSVTVKSGPDFQKLYDDYCSSTFAILASDGSYLSIDTNPYDIDDYTDSSAIQAIRDVVSALGIPDSFINDLGHTRALDGRQNADFDDVSASWSYHPNSGLEVTFKAK